MNPSISKTNHGMLRATLALSVLIFASCSTYEMIKVPPPEEIEPFPMVDTGAPIQLKPGDQIEIKVYAYPDLDDIQTIRPDGKITLSRLDEIQAAGRTPAELDNILTEQYKEKIKQVELSIIVREIAEQRIFVGGEVLTPGVIEMRGNMTVLEAVMAAGGFNKMSAASERIVLIRTIENRRYGAIVNLRDTLLSPLSREELEVPQNFGPFYLAPKDIVLVPPSRIDQYNSWVEQYINRILPAGITASHPLGAEGMWGIDLSRGVR